MLLGRNHVAAVAEIGEWLMFRRRVLILRRPRLLGAALVGGLGFAAGRASRGPSQTAPNAPAPGPTDVAAKLKQLADLHSSGALTDEEFAAAKGKLLES
jgi:hypothetical protein